MSQLQLNKIRRQIVAFFCHLYPFYSGCGLFANSRFVQVLAGGKTDQLGWAKLRCGVKALVPLNDLVGCALFYVGDLDKKVSWVCKCVLRKGDLVIDVGGNMGLVSFICSKIVGSSGRVVAYEPNPQMVSLFTQSIQRNQIENIDLYPIGLGIECGSMELHVPEDNAGKGSLVRSYDGSQCTVAVSVENTSVAFFKNTLKRARLMKIDVEGFEEQVLLGAREYINEMPPEVILFEINDYNEPLEDHPCIMLLEELGYCVFGLPKRMLMMQAEKLDKTQPSPEINDFVAVHINEDFGSIKKLLGVDG